MHTLTQHIFSLRDTATDGANDARNRLVQLLHNGDGQIGPVMTEMLHLQAYARWWHTVTDHIEHHRMDAAAALSRARSAARHTLLDQITPLSACPFTYGQAVAFIEATRHFYQDTATIETDPAPRCGDRPPGEVLPPVFTRTSPGADATSAAYTDPRRPK